MITNAEQSKILIHEQLNSPPVLWWDPCCSSFKCFVLSYYVFLRSEFRVVVSVTISA